MTRRCHIACPALKRVAYKKRADSAAWQHLYWTARWKRIRDAQLSSEPLCVMCLADEIVEPATVYDHVTPHKGDTTMFWSGPFQSLCKPHHDSDKQREERGGPMPFGADGYPL